jgi:hypothetical protein
MTVRLHNFEGSMAVTQMLRDATFAQRKRADADASARCGICDLTI